MLKWNFPNNGCGQIRGISDAGIETFTGSEIKSLARETCQNSLDAKINGNNKKVHIEFERYCINSEDIPEKIREELNKLFEKLDKYYPNKIIYDTTKMDMKTLKSVLSISKTLKYSKASEFLKAYGYEMIEN